MIARFLRLPLLSVFSSVAVGQAPPVEESPADEGWPREFKTDAHTVVVFPSQVEEWIEYKALKMRAAVALNGSGNNSRLCIAS